MKKLKCLVLLSMIILLMSFIPINVKAAGSVTIFLDKTQLTADEELRVTIQTSEPEDDAVQPEVVLNYDSSLLEFEYCSGEYGGGEGGLITFKGTKANLSFIAKKGGTASLEAEAVIDEDGNNKATAERSVTITGGNGTTESSKEDTTDSDEEGTVTNTTKDDNEDEEIQSVQDRELSSNANLKKFNLTDAKIEPKFNKNHTEYTITLEENMPQLYFSAKTSSKKAKIIAVSGFSNLKNGSNKAVLNVKAEDGTIKAYYFTIIKEGKAASTEDTEAREVAEAVDGMIPIADSELFVNTTFPADFLPDGCIKVDYIYKEQVVEAAYFEQGEVMLLYLTNQDESDGDFYIYYSGTDEFMDFIQIKCFEGQFVFPVQFPVGVVIPDRFSDSSMQWGEKTVPAFMVSGTEDTESATGSVSINDEAQMMEEESSNLNPKVESTDFYLLYAMNQDGEEGFYLYDTLEGTYQRYLDLTYYEEQAGTFDEESYVIYKNKSQQRMVVIGVLIIIIVILAFILLNMYLSLKEFKEDDDEIEDDEVKENNTKENNTKENIAKEQKAKEQKAKAQKVNDNESNDNEALSEKGGKKLLGKLISNKEEKTVDKKVPKRRGAEKKSSKKKKPKAVASKNVFEQIEEMEKAEKAPKREENKPIRKPIMYDLSTPKIDGSLTPKMQREKLDDDFEFEFIKIDDEE